MIRVLHVTEDHSAANTGIAMAVDGLVRCIPEGIQPSIACVGEETIPLPEGLPLYCFPTRGISTVWRFSPGADQTLGEAVAEADVVHVHGLWMWIQWAAARQASRQGKPWVITPHGMLAPWIWQRQAWPHQLKKYLYWNGLAYPAFRRARVVHALTEEDASVLTSYFPGQERVMIPNGIDLADVDHALDRPAPDAGDARYFLFVGRLHPVKAIHLLLRAFARLPGKTYRLIIAGPTQPQEQAYASSLRQLAADLGLGGRVSFTGAVHGSEKWALYEGAWAFVLPSFSEGLSGVNLEAASCRCPVITTRESGMVAEWDACGGVFVRPEEESILSGLLQAANWTDAERASRGKSLRALIERNYAWDVVGKQWASVYERLAGEAQHG